MDPKMSNIHDGDEKIPTSSTLGRIRVNQLELPRLKGINCIQQVISDLFLKLGFWACIIMRLW